MIEVKYRIVEEINVEGQWDIIGAVVLWPDGLRPLLQHTASPPIWREICRYVQEHQLSLENYERALGEYARYYRISPEIHTLEGETVQELRQRLRQMYVFSRETTLMEAR